jgi:CRISPR-associated exonuclease Cas4
VSLAQSLTFDITTREFKYEIAASRGMHTFRDLETAAYCPRKLYYRRREPDADVQIPDTVRDRRELAFAYETLLESDSDLRGAPIEITPTQFRSRVSCAKARLDDWDALVDPPEREVFIEGKDARGIAHKVIDDPPRPALVFAGEPPEQGIWEPQTVRLVAAASALAWDRETRVDTVFAEYPAFGVIREIDVTSRRRAIYRAALRTADAIDGPPSRVANRSKCDACEYRTDCGVTTRSLRSLL